MSTVITSQLLANGIRREFASTYESRRQLLPDSRMGMVLDIIGATNRIEEFGFIEAAPHVELWQQGDPIPTDGMSDLYQSVKVYDWGRRIRWHKNDRDDERTGSLLKMARMAGASAATLPERLAMDVIGGTTNTLPAVPNAIDGAAMYATTDGNSNDRFGVTDGNLLSGNGVASASAIKQDYYNAIEQFKLMQDGKSQPRWSDEVVDGGVIVLHAASNTEAFEEAFMQRRQGEVQGTDAGVTPTNLIQDASRDVTLWGTQRLTGNDWYVFLKRAPDKALFALDRQGVETHQALMEDNNSDDVRSTKLEYVQFDLRMGIGINLPDTTIKINN